MSTIAIRVLKSLYELLPPRIKGMTDYYSGHKGFFYPSDGPMNGQEFRLTILNDLFRRINFDEIVETGTFRAQTTEYFAEFGVPVVSIECSVRFFEFSRRRLARFSNAKLLLGDSATILRTYLESSKNERLRFFYLDAHWYGSPPLRAELLSISRYCAEAVVMIDDYAVPGDPGYGFDDYGPGDALNIDLLFGLELSGTEIYFPNCAAERETGRRRGCVVLGIGENVISKLSDSSCLRPYSRIKTLKRE